MDDKHIIGLFFDRAEGAIAALSEKYGQPLRRLCMNLLNDPQDAEECVNDTYLAIWNAIPPACPEVLSAYLYKTGRNIALKRLRSRTAQKRSAYEISLDELAECIPSVCLEETADARALGEAIDRYLDTLSKGNRILFLRRYWFGDGIADLARHTGLRQNTVSVRLARMRAALKDYLTQEGFL